VSEENTSDQIKSSGCRWVNEQTKGRVCWNLIFPRMTDYWLKRLHKVIRGWGAEVATYRRLLLDAFLRGW